MESPKRGCDLGTCVVKRWRFKKLRIAIISCVLKASRGARACVQVDPLRSKNVAFCVCVLEPTKIIFH